MDVAGVTITHPDRVVFPELGATKLDVARYYARIAPLMLPHIRGRPLALVRCPEGSGAQCFFQKHWVGTLPETIDTVMIRQSDGKRHPHVVVNNARGLVTLAQWGVMEVHLWGAKAADPEHPDRVVLDLDPSGGVAWKAVLEGAHLIRAVLTELDLKCWIKTTGGKGLHVVVPIAPRSEWTLAKEFAHGIANVLASQAPDRFVATASKSKRSGKIYVDWLRNTRGASWVAPWSLRARPNAGISAPFSWTAIARTSSAEALTLVTLRRLPSSDPWREMLSSRQSLTQRAIGRLQEALQ